MTTEQLDVFVHCYGTKPKKLTAEPHERLRDILTKGGCSADNLVFVGEWNEALAEVEGGEDSHEPVDPDRVIRDLEIRNHEHIHCHKCKRIDVEINYGSGTKRHKFSPATTIDVVTQWAKKKFMLDDASAGDLVLQKCGTKEHPRPNQHLGEVVDPVNCKICLDLVKEVTPQG